VDHQALVGQDEHALIATNEPRGKGRTKAKTKPTSEAKSKRSLNLSLPPEDYERLAIHALRLDTTISELVSKLAREHCREFHITRTASRD